MPNPVIGQYGEQAFALIELQHVGAVGAIGPGMGEVFGVVEVEVGIEVDIGRRVFVFQVQLGQFWIARLIFCFLLLVLVQVVIRLKRMLAVAVAVGRVGGFIGRGFCWLFAGVSRRLFGGLFGLLIFFGQVFAHMLFDAERVQQQVAAGLIVFVPQAFGDDDQMAALGGPLAQALGLFGRQVFARAEHDQGLPFAGQAGKHFQAVGALHLAALLGEKLLGGQIRIALHLRRRPVFDDLLVGCGDAQQVDAEQAEEQEDPRAEEKARAPGHGRTCGSSGCGLNNRRQPSQRPRLRLAGGS